ncbi:hypothetical protein PCH_Pc12g03580 [Penicillium rubens Wisconsin 54-1255]|uniref:Uncharacterized protein n=1 Tax=Penicillium rubens (strain ATCC 28089 / DSM 1075 / NRRL 1951 / Wisconsin 54-1255) TaxID=500485 RepID=B6GWQ1_PENRW|nr:hypothetical protein PCH_Pc12g03580 [Penicillium rubens Wisconsin 54-1255]
MKIGNIVEAAKSGYKICPRPTMAQQQCRITARSSKVFAVKGSDPSSEFQDDISQLLVRVPGHLGARFLVGVTAKIVAGVDSVRKYLVQVVGHQPIGGGLILRQFDPRVVPVYSFCKQHPGIGGIKHDCALRSVRSAIPVGVKRKRLISPATISPRLLRMDEPAFLREFAERVEEIVRSSDP